MHDRHVIALSIVLGLTIISIMVLVARFLWVHRAAKDQSDSSTSSAYSPDPVVMQQSATTPREKLLLRLFAPKKERGVWVPSLSGVVKAGDDGVYSSTLFNQLHARPGALHLDALYDAFAKELRRRPVTERAAYSSEISRFLPMVQAREGPRRRHSVKIPRVGRPELPPRSKRHSIDVAEQGLGVGRSRSRKTAPVLVSAVNGLVGEEGDQGPNHGLWSRDVQRAQYVEGKTAISVTAKELAALSIMLGSPVNIALDSKGSEHPERRSSASKGAFGISISATPTATGNYHISLTKHPRTISQLPALGSGYSPLHAKHFAASSLPISQSRKTTTTMLLAPSTLEALRTGTPLHLHPTPASTPPSKFLASLPNARQPLFHTLLPSDKQTSTPLLLHAIADLPFTGGLPPLATTPLINIIRFVASGGLPAGRLLQRLDALVEKVHRHSPHLHLFGPLLETAHAGLLFRERERLGKLAAGAAVDDALADKVARVHRYVTLLERLMCLVPDMRERDVLAAVREATRKEVERSYEDSVAAYLHPPPPATSSMQDKDTASTSTDESVAGSMAKCRTRRSKRESRRSSGAYTASSPGPEPGSPVPASLTSPRPSSTFPRENLGTLVEQILKAPLPLDVNGVALVARLVLVAWTFSVEVVGWGEGEEGWRVDGLGGLEVTGEMVMF